MKSLFKVRNLYRAGWVAIDREDVRLIDSNELMNEKMEVWGTPNRSLEDYDDGGDEMEFTGLNPTQIEGLFGEENFIHAAETEMPADGEVAAESDDEEAISEKAKEASEETMAMAEKYLEEAKERLAYTRDECDHMIADAQEEIEYAKETAAEEGRVRGYEEGMTRAQGEIEQLKEEVRADRLRLQQEYEQLTLELEPRFVSVLTDIYEKVFGTLLTDYAPIVTHMLAGAMSADKGSKDFIIRVSETEYDHVISHRDEIRANASVGEANIEIIKDRTLAAGACLIETEGGVYDVGFDTQLTNLNKKLHLLSYER
ncbi:MAG: hypothetical protein LBC96_06600 [Lachnospiraceae bacterium]|jgi:flagellar assembly protein FliH|nr:hypothetical protein [Lachnospiraceae bacterium]